MNGTQKRRRKKKQAPVLRVSARRRKKSNERTMRLLGLAAVPVGVIVGAFLLWLGVRELGALLYARSDAFTIRHLEVRAASTRTRALARDYTQIAEGQNIFEFDIRAVRDFVMANSPNFQSMTITRYLPDTVIIEVVDRTPLARIGRRGDMVADSEGYVFISRSGVRGLPTISGYDSAELKPGVQLEGPIVAALQVVEACEGPLLDMRPVDVDISDPEQIELKMEYGERTRAVKLTWRGMGQPSAAAHKQLMATLTFVKQAFDSPKGRRLSKLDATIEGRLYGAK